MDLPLYQPAEMLTHRCQRLHQARRQYPIEPPDVFAMDVPVGRRQLESGSASFGIMGCWKDSRWLPPIPAITRIAS